MSRVFDDASSQYITNANAVVSTVPLTLACWFRSDDVTAKQLLMAIGTGGTSNHYFALVADGTDGGDVLKAITRETSDATAVTTTGFSADVWHHACAVFAATNDRRVYIDGGSKGTQTSTRTPAGMDNTTIAKHPGASSWYMSGRIAEAGIWNVALSDADTLSLAQGFSPLFIRPSSLMAYWPLGGSHGQNDTDPVGGYAMSPSGAPTFSDGPPIHYQSLINAPFVDSGGAPSSPLPAAMQHFRRRRAG